MNASIMKERIDAATGLTGEGPRPLFRELPPAPLFPVEALGPVLGKAATAIERVIQCPMACAANSVLAVASLAAQGRADVVLPIGEGKAAPIGLFLLTVLHSGERKSSADGLALKPVRAFERELAEAESGERAAHAVKQAAWDASHKQLLVQHKNDRPALEAALHDLGPAPLLPLLSVIAPSSDQTMEGLFRVYQQGRPSLAMLCDDAATFLGGHSFKAEQKVATTANLCRAWDGSKLERVRGGDGVIVLYDRRLACHFMVQPGVAANFLSDPQFADQGLIARFLLSAPDGRAGTRFRDDFEYQAVTRQAGSDLDDYDAAVMRLLRQPVRWKDENDRTLGVNMRRLEFASDARALFVEFLNDIEGRLGPAGSLATVQAFASKLPEHAARIAATLALIRDAEADSIDRATLADATELARYYLAEAVRLVAAGAIDPELRQAETLRQWLLVRQGGVIDLTTVYQRGPSSIRQAAKARAAMNVLVEHGWARSLPDGAEIDGKHHRDAWEIVRC